jgi:hypothetical protein
LPGLKLSACLGYRVTKEPQFWPIDSRCVLGPSRGLAATVKEQNTVVIRGMIAKPRQFLYVGEVLTWRPARGFYLEDGKVG